MAKEQFLGRHVGPRPEDVEEMLKVIGVKSVDELIEQTDTGIHPFTGTVGFACSLD